MAVRVPCVGINVSAILPDVDMARWDAHDSLDTWLEHPGTKNHRHQDGLCNMANHMRRAWNESGERARVQL